MDTQLKDYEVGLYITYIIPYTVFINARSAAEAEAKAIKAGWVTPVDRLIHFDPSIQVRPEEVTCTHCLEA